MALFPAPRATTISLVRASGLTIGFGVRLQFRVHSPTPISRTIDRRGATRAAAAFGEGGSLGIFTIAPTIKPRGGFFTRPELRAFATFAVWSDELKGAIGGSPYANQNYGWIFGVQAETWW